MAFGVSVVGLVNTEDPDWTAQLPWWNKQELMADPRFRDSECPDSRYHDYVAILRRYEFLELHERYKGSYLEFLGDDVPGKDTSEHWWSPHYRTVEKELYVDPRRTTWFFVTVYEWESGM